MQALLSFSFHWWKAARCRGVTSLPHGAFEPRSFSCKTCRIPQTLSPSNLGTALSSASVSIFLSPSLQPPPYCEASLSLTSSDNCNCNKARAAQEWRRNGMRHLCGGSKMTEGLMSQNLPRPLRSRWQLWGPPIHQFNSDMLLIFTSHTPCLPFYRCGHWGWRNGKRLTWPMVSTAGTKCHRLWIAGLSLNCWSTVHANANGRLGASVDGAWIHSWFTLLFWRQQWGECGLCI